MKKTIFILFIALFFATVSSKNYLYVSFKDPGSDGIYFNISHDGYHWKTINGGNPVVRTSEDFGGMRDPFITVDPKKGYHLVWTGGSSKGSFGYAFSEDLIHWKTMKSIKVFEPNDSAQNVWAPELSYDNATKQWVFYWSSTIKGAFPETMGQVENERNHRIYGATTNDFETFSKPFLFFDPGYPVIDATIFEEKGKYTMIFKDERRSPLYKNLRMATASSLFGPWKNVTDTLTQSWTEGPTMIKLKNQYVIYYDKYVGGQQMKAIGSKSMTTWKDITPNITIPKKMKHGSFIRITNKAAKQLNSLNKDEKELSL